MTRLRRRSAHKVLAYPKDHNPYQRELYAAVKTTAPDIDVWLCPKVRWVSPALLLLAAPVLRLLGFRVVHLHWPDFTWTDRSGQINPERSLALSTFSIRYLSALGYALVWTCHNFLPHEAQTSDDKAVTELVIRTSAHVFVHDSVAEGQVTDLVPGSPVTVVTHPPYDNYGSTTDRDAALTRIGLGDFPGRTMLALGNVRPYKGIDAMIGALPLLADLGARLVVAGRCDDADLDQALREAAAAGRPITYRPGYVPDELVSTYFSVADFSCLPFREVTTSGSAMLSLGFGVPIIAPNAGSLRDLPAQASLLYEPASDGRSLDDALTAASRMSDAELLQMKGRAREYVDTATWDAAATAVVAVLRRLP